MLKIRWSRKALLSWNLQGSLPKLQRPATEYHPEPLKSSSHLYIWLP
jgi:hypothetical protein